MMKLCVLNSNKVSLQSGIESRSKVQGSLRIVVKSLIATAFC